VSVYSMSRPPAKKMPNAARLYASRIEPSVAPRDQSRIAGSPCERRAGLRRLRGRSLWRRGYRSGGSARSRRRALVNDRPWCPIAIAEPNQRQARQHEDEGEDCGRARQQIRCRAAGHKPGHAAASHAERAAFALLQQDDANERNRDQDMDDKKQDDHQDLVTALRAARQRSGGWLSAAASDAPETLGVEARSADQGTIDLGEAKNPRGVLRIDRSAIEDPRARRDRRANGDVHCRDVFQRRAKTGADRPDGLISDDKVI